MDKQIIFTESAPAPIGPYSQAILAGNTLYASGQIAIDAASGEMVLESIEAETNKVLENVGAVLKAAGMDFSNVVKTSIFIKDMDHFKRINNVYNKYFEAYKPARETVEVARLPKDVNIEISVIAVM